MNINKTNAGTSVNIAFFKPHYIYVFKLEGRADVFEAEFISSIRGYLIWQYLRFSCSEGKGPRFTHFAKIEWAEEVMFSGPLVTEADYSEALKKLPS